MANFVAPSFALANLMPRKLNFRRAAVVSAIIGFVILPWNLYSSPIVIVYFLGGLGAFLGPLFGIVMADYWLLRKQQVDVPALYTYDPAGPYHYRNGINPKAIKALIPSALISLVFAFLPALHVGVALLLVHRRRPGRRLLLRHRAEGPDLRRPRRRGHRRRHHALTRTHQRKPPMRILIVNVNTTESMTEGIGAQARKVAAAGTEIVALTPRFGAESVEGNFESYLAAVGVMDAVMRYDAPFDAVIQAGYGEHGREGLQELLDVPVVDITEAAASTAMFLGHKYSVVTTLDRAVPLIEDRLKLAGLDARCASVRASGMAVLELETQPERAVEAIVDQASIAVTQDHAEVICLGCGGMAELEAKVRERTGVPVVDGVAAAVTIAESLVRLGLTTSKVRTFAPPRTKRITGFPLPLDATVAARSPAPAQA